MERSGSLDEFVVGSERGILRINGCVQRVVQVGGALGLSLGGRAPLVRFSPPTYHSPPPRAYRPLSAEKYPTPKYFENTVLINKCEIFETKKTHQEKI